MASRTENATAFKLTVLTAAIGAGTMGTAGAVTISKAPAGFTPLVITSNAGTSNAFDTDGNGTVDFTITSNGSGYISLNAPTSVSTFSGFSSVNTYASPGSFIPVTSLKGNSSGGANNSITSIGSVGANSYFSPNVPLYAELATNVTYSSNGTPASGTIGYILGTRSVLSGAGTAAEIDTFTVSDFGVIGDATAVPEPSSLALLALGGAGVAALRRRRQARHAA